MSTSDFKILEVDVLNCTTTIISTDSVILPDIGFNPVDDKLYGIGAPLGSSGSYIYEINLQNGVMTNLMEVNFPGFVGTNSMTFDHQGICFVFSYASDALYTINIETGEVDYVGTTGLGAISSGDLTWFEGELYLSATPNSLVHIDTANIANSELIGVFEDSDLAVWGVTTHRCGNKFLAFSHQNIYQLNQENLLESTLLCSDVIAEMTWIYGAASTTEASLLASDYSGILQNQLLCEGDTIEVLNPYLNPNAIWSNGTHDSLFYFMDEGNYSISIADECGVFVDDFEVVFDTCDTYLEENNIEFLEIYPIPVKDYISLNLKKAFVRLFAANGDLLVEQEVTEQSSIDVSTLAKGVYILQVYTQGKIHSKKLVLD